MEKQKKKHGMTLGLNMARKINGTLEEKFSAYMKAGFIVNRSGEVRDKAGRLIDNLNWTEGEIPQKKAEGISNPMVKLDLSLIPKL